MNVSLRQAQAHYITVDGARLPLIVTRHARARSFIVRYDAKSDAVKLTYPRYSSLARALAFAQSRTGWIARQREKRVQPIVLADGASVPLFGRTVTLRHSGGRGTAKWEEDALWIAGAPEFFGRRLQEAIRAKALDVFKELSVRHAQRIGVGVRRVSLRETSSRWGSCSHAGNLSYCWRLAFAPYEVLDYVVCHEVAHLKHLNHSPAYWRVVKELCGDFERHEHWLKYHGQSVWHYQ